MADERQMQIIVERGLLKNTMVISIADFTGIFHTTPFETNVVITLDNKQADSLAFHIQTELQDQEIAEAERLKNLKEQANVN